MGVYLRFACIPAFRDAARPIHRLVRPSGHYDPTHSMPAKQGSAPVEEVQTEHCASSGDRHFCILCCIIRHTDSQQLRFLLLLGMLQFADPAPGSSTCCCLQATFQAK